MQNCWTSWRRTFVNKIQKLGTNGSDRLVTRLVTQYFSNFNMLKGTDSTTLYLSKKPQYLLEFTFGNQQNFDWLIQWRVDPERQIRHECVAYSRWKWLGRCCQRYVYDWKDSKNICSELLQIDSTGKLLGVGEGSAGNSPLQMAILKSDESLAELILRFCNIDDINHRNFKGETALHQATVNGLGMWLWGFVGLVLFLSLFRSYGTVANPWRRCFCFRRSRKIAPICPLNDTRRVECFVWYLRAYVEIREQT